MLELRKLNIVINLNWVLKPGEVDCVHRVADYSTRIRAFYTFFIARQHNDARYCYSNSVRPSVRLPSAVRHVPVFYLNDLTR